MVLSVVYEDNAAAFNAAETWFGKNFDGATVFTGDNGWADYDGSVNYAIGVTAADNTQRFWSIPLFSNTGNLHDAGTGAYNSHYVSAAQKIAASQTGTGPIYIRTGWEFNSNWEPWSATTDPTDYKAAYQQFVDSYRTVSSRFVFVWCPALGGGGMNPADAYPGDKYVDIIGQDVYLNKQYNTDPGGDATFNYDRTGAYGLQWAADFAKAHGKGLATPEWGTNSNDSGAFVKDMAAWFTSHNEVYQGFWDSNGAFAGGKLSDGNNPAAGTAFQQAIGAITASAPSVTAHALTAAVAPAAHAHVASDFDGDGKSDILMMNATTGDVGVWESSHGSGASSFTDLATGVPTGWTIAGTGDFDGDGNPDVLWRNTGTGEVGMWTSAHGLNNASFISLGTVSTDYHVAGVGDFDGDGKSDILWNNATTGDTGAWESSKGLSNSNYVDFGVGPAGYKIEGVGDFDGDGKADVLWFNSTTLTAGIWESSKGVGAPSFVSFGTVSKSWAVAGVGDFDGDGKADVLWRNADGEVGLWESTRGFGTAHWVDLGHVDNAWKIVGVGDYDGDGKADVLWHNTTTGQMAEWQSSHGLATSAAVFLSNLNPGYTVATHGDYIG